MTTELSRHDAHLERLRDEYRPRPARLHFSAKTFAATRAASKLRKRLVWTDYLCGRCDFTACVERATVAASKAFGVSESEIIGCGFWQTSTPLRPCMRSDA